MKKFLKQMAAGFLAIALVFSGMPLSAFANTGNPESAEPEIVGITFEDTAYKEGQYSQYETDETGTEYGVYNIKNSNWTLELSTGKTMAAGDVFGGETGFWYNGQGYTFEYEYGPNTPVQSKENPWTAGGTYEIIVKVYDPNGEYLFDGSFQCSIVEDRLESVTFEPMEVTEYSGGVMIDPETDWEGNFKEAWYYYNLENGNYTVKFKDDDKLYEPAELGGDEYGFYCGDIYYPIELVFNDSTTQSYENRLKASETPYTVNVKVGDYETSFTYTINPTKATELVVNNDEPVEILANTNGDMVTDWRGNTYFKYNEDATWKEYSLTIDGETHSSEGAIEYNDESHYPLIVTNQCYEQQWTAGNTYDVDMYILGKKATYQVKIVDNPVDRVEFAPKSSIEGTDGNVQMPYESEGTLIGAWHEYDVYNPNYKVVLKDGTEISSTSDGFEGDATGFTYEGYKFDFFYDTGQSYENQWKPGNHEVSITVSNLDKESSYIYTIEDSPIESIEFDSMSTLKGTGGQWNEVYDDNGEVTGEWYEYDCYNPSYTVVLEGGVVLSSTSEDFESDAPAYRFTYEGNEYNIVYNTGQRYSSPWDTGTYTVTASVGSVTDEFTYEIVESPIESITFEDMSATEIKGAETYGTETDGVEYSWYHYNINNPNYTIKLKDSDTTISSTDEDFNGDSAGFWYNNLYYGFEYVDEQDYENQWKPGDHTVKVNVPGVDIETSFKYTVKEFPIASITFEPMKAVYNVSGGYWTDYDAEGESEVERWYYYDVENPNYTVNLKNGKSLSTGDKDFDGNEYGFTYDGEQYCLYYYSDQDYDTPWKIGDHTVRVEVGDIDLTSSYTYTVEKCPIRKVVFEEQSVCEGTSGNQEEILDENGNVTGSWYRYELNTTPSFKAYLEGNVEVEEGEGDFIYYDTGFSYEGIDYWFTFSDDQSSENQWKVGSHTMYASVSDLVCEIPFEVVASPVTDINIDPITVYEKLDSDVVDGDVYYYLHNAIHGTVTFDGTAYDIEDGGIYVGDDWYPVDYTIDERGLPWEPGETYEIVISCVGYSDTVEVSVEECPIESFVIKPLKYKAFTKGEEVTDENGTYWYYDVDSPLYPITINLKNGETITSDESGWVEFSGNRYAVCSRSDQSFENQWVAGKTYTATAYVGNFEQEYEVSIVKELSVLDCLSWDIEGEEVTITRCDTALSGVCEIPAELEGLPVTKIGEGAFRNCTDLTEIIIPEGVTEIGCEAFTGCYGLDSITFPTTLSYVGENAFWECNNNLSEVHIGDYDAWFNISFENLDSTPFYTRVAKLYVDGEEITDFTIPTNITELKNYSMAGFFSLNEIVIPDNIIEIGDGAFASCLNLEKATLPDTITHIGDYAFYSNTTLCARDNNECVKAFAYENGRNFETLDFTFVSMDYTPEKDTYNVGEACEMVGDTVTVLCSDVYGTFTKDITIEDSMITGFDTSEPGAKLVTISYANLEHTFPITVVENEPINIEDTDVQVSLDRVSYEYDGVAKEPKVTITGITGEYTTKITYANNQNAGTATVTIEFGGKYTGSIVTEFWILRANFAKYENKVKLSNTTFACDGTAKKPKVSIEGLTEGKDFTVEYSNNINVGTATVTIEGVENYTGTIEKTFDIYCSGSFHVWNTGYTTDKTPTCTTAGSKSIHCKECSATKDVTAIPANGTSHTWNTTYTVDKASTCTATGSKSIHCKECKATKDVESIAKKPHAEVTLKGKAATCKATGLSDGKKCSVCGTTTVKQKVIEKIPHDETTVEGVQPTCTEAGLTEGKVCTTCGVVTVAQTEIPATGHTEQVVAGKAATCTEAGLTEGKVCTTCGVVTVAHTEIPATGHTEQVVAGKAPTCTEAGLTEGKVCTTCGVVTVAQTEIPMENHSYVTVITKATTQKNGKIVEKCECGAIASTTVIKKASKISLSKDTYTYTGKKIKAPTVIVKNSDGKVIPKANYTIKEPAKTLKAVGQYTYTVTFKGDKYKGSKKLTLTIQSKKAASANKPSGNNGTATKPNNGTANKPNNKPADKPTNSTVTKPAKPIIKAPVAAKKAVTVKWQKVKKADGYQVMVATDKKFQKNDKKVLVKGTNKMSCKVTKLKAKKTYYVKVRAYKTVNGKKVYSKWSAVKSAKTK